MDDVSYPIKAGYFRIMEADGKSYSTVSYTEALAYDESFYSRLKAKIDAGQCTLYCACCSSNLLELSVTANNIIRVKNNGQQDQHMESCPKSKCYSSWLSENMKGTRFDNETNKLFFKIALPGTVKQKSNSSSSSSSSSGTTTNSRMKLLDMAKTLNAYTWEKQTFSKKKEIALAHKENRVPDWQYKKSSDFIKQLYAVTNDIGIQVGSSYGTLHDILYQKDVFAQCTDFHRRFFIYAEIEKVSPFKEERKYQYVTLRMPSTKSPYKTVIRVPTEEFKKLFADSFSENSSDNDIDEENITKVLCGYINRSIFPNQDGTVTEWANLLKGVVIYTSKNGLYAETPYIAKLIDAMAEEHLIFKRPYMPLENYYNTIPTLMLERVHEKNILIDVLFEEKESIKEQHESWGKDNSEFLCVLLYENFPISDALETIQQYKSP